MSAFQNTCDVVIEGGLIALLVFAPACLGAVHPLAFAVLQAAMFVLAVAWAMKAGLRETSASTPGRRRVATVCIATFMVYGLVQWLSLASFMPTTASGYATRVALGKALTYAMAFLLVVGNLRRRDQLRRITTAILCIGAVIALLGLVQILAPMDSIYWWWKPEDGVRPFGPYMSKTHFAGYMVMAIPLALCSALAQRETKASGRWLPILPGAAAAVMLLALLFCRAPEGIVAFLVSSLFLLIFAGSKNHAKVKNIFGMVGAAGLIALLWLLAPTILGNAVVGNEKALIWRGAVRMWRNSPVWGVGAGTFANVFPAYQNPALGAADVASASSDLLQALVEVGVVGFAIAMAFFTTWWVQSIRAWRLGKDIGDRWVIAGGMASAAGMFALGLFTSCFRAPANAFAFAVVLGVGYSLAELALDRESEEKRQAVEE
ncbi:MAG: O-antigen ligase family protein [Planctomycetota bacterium]